MHPDIVVPQLDPIPLPGPIGLFWVLLTLTFLLHTLAMNCVVGGSLISIVARFRSKHPFHARLAGDLGRKIPSLLAATITLGVAPLLFVQVLYGQFFYTSSAIMAWPWLAVIPVLIFGYYAAYLVAFKEGSRHAQKAAIGSLLAFLTIAFIYTNNFTFMLTPEKWFPKYSRSTSGLNLNLDEPMLWPRLFHTLVAAAAVAGFLVIIMALANWKKDENYARLLLQHGAYWFIVPTMLQFAVGTWFLISLPEEKMFLYLGGDWRATVLFGISSLATLGAVFVMILAARSPLPHRRVITSLVHVIVVLVCMTLMRDLLRSAYLEEYLEAPVTRVQWDVMVLFLVLFLGALGLWGMMLLKYFKRAKSTIYRRRILSDE
ncbi:MAG TPA: hypothetical protein PLP42_03445 [Acidobacteriota bacterium]|nr:hypothetical protein [Acidobacteriota bacterium]